MPKPRAPANVSSDDAAPLTAVLSSDLPQTWAKLARVFYATLLKLPDQAQPREQMARTALELVRGLARDMGGDQVYIPKNHAHEVAAKCAAIRREFRGRNHRQLAEKYGISVMRVRQILAS